MNYRSHNHALIMLRKALATVERYYGELREETSVAPM